MVRAEFSCSELEHGSMVTKRAGEFLGKAEKATLR